MPIDVVIQVGLDYWHLGAPPASASVNRRLFLADSTPQWDYHNPAPWLTLEGHARASQDIQFNLKLRANQSAGSRLTEANVDWSLSPSLGLRGGVVDFKTSWCRTYDIDSPWVRENDPFCTVRTTDQATGAAPGLQAYLKTNAGPYDVQAVGGMYRPKVLGYDPKEFNSIVIDHGSRVERNNKSGLAINLLNVETATEFRFSWLHSDQSGHVQDAASLPFYRALLAGDVYYFASSFLVTDRLKVRVSRLRSSMKYSSFSYPGDDNSQISPPMFNAGRIRRDSSTVELNYQLTPRDVLAAAYSAYRLGHVEQPYVNPGTSADQTPSATDFAFRNNSLSLAWRHDYRRGLFTALQWTRATMAQVDYFNATNSANAGRYAVGLRLGFEF